MNTQAEKLKLIEWIVGLQDAGILEKIKFLKEHPKVGDEMWEIISEDEKHSIERGLDDILKGKITPHSEIRKGYEKWL